MLPSILQGDGPALEAALNRALGFQEGICERQIIVGTPAGEHFASAGIGPESTWPAPFLRGVRGDTLEFPADASALWVQRGPDEDGRRIAYIAAQLDVGTLSQRRQRFREAMVLFSLALAVVGGGLTAFAARRTIRPVLVVTDALDRAGRGRIARIPGHALPADGTAARRLALALALAFNATRRGCRGCAAGASLAGQCVGAAQPHRARHAARADRRDRPVRPVPRTGQGDHVPLAAAPPAAERADGDAPAAPEEPSSLAEARETAEREHIRRVLARCRGRVGDAAQALGVSRTTLWHRMRRLGLPSR